MIRMSAPLVRNAVVSNMKLKSVILSLAVACGPVVFAGEPAKLDEVNKLLRDNLPGATENSLNEAAVKGLIHQLEPRVSLAGAETGEPAPLIIKTAVYDGAYASLQVGRVEQGLGDKVAETLKTIGSTNTIKGLILDLRYATGTDYAAAAAVADLFLDSDQLLLDWGEGAARATSKTNAIAVPVSVLVNKHSRGAAEALAAVFREAHAGLILGGHTASEASLYKTFPLSDGTRLRIAVAPVKLADGTALDRGVSPDIFVPVSPDDEKTFFGNPYALFRREGGSEGDDTQVGSPRNRGRFRINEAELVRQQRMGPDAAEGDSRRKSEPERPVVTDPVLGRALDLLKGLSVVRRGNDGALRGPFSR
jgi:hypothetical protein